MAENKYQAYPQYKDSGIGWCGTLPLSWTFSSLRWLATLYAGGTPSKNSVEYWGNGEIPWINSGAVNQGYITEASEYISKAAFNNSSAKWIPKKALVVALAGQGKAKGMVAQLGIATTCNQSVAAIVLHQERRSRYLFWWLTSNYQNIRNMSGGDLRDGLNLELLGDIACPLPSEQECEAISVFIDYETDKINHLIEKQQQLIELLKEKRQAVISHAVTKGLDPDVPVKDSGIEWLGTIPENWTVSRLKYRASIVGRIGFRGYTTNDIVDEGEGAIALSPSNVDDSRLVLDKKTYISWVKYDESPEIVVKNNDIVIVKTGSTYGKSAIINNATEPMTINPQMALIKNDRVEQRYLYYFLNSSFIRSKMDVANTGSGIPTMTQENMNSFPVLIPHGHLSEVIADFIDAENSKFNALVDKCYQQIELLQERRSALIAAAVTGKIDVRHWVAPAASVSAVDTAAQGVNA